MSDLIKWILIGIVAVIGAVLGFLFIRNKNDKAPQAKFVSPQPWEKNNKETANV